VLIEDALGQWQEATSGLITMMPARLTSWTETNPVYEPCTFYPDFTPSTTPIDWFAEMSSRLGRDGGLSEIRVVDSPSPGDVVAGSLIQVLLTDPFKGCILYSEFIACVSSHSGFLAAPQQASTKLPSADSIFNHDAIYPPTPTVGPNMPDAVVFNSCVSQSTLVPDLNDIDHCAYATAVH
jgi:hypothetical protein